MKLVICGLLLSLSLASSAQAQKRKTPKSRQPARPRQVETRTPVARIIGSPITVSTRNGGQVSGTVLGLDASSIRVRTTNNLDSVIPMETIASISFKPASGPAQQPKEHGARLRPNFTQDVGTISTAFRSIAATTQSGVDYADYGRHLTELRRTIEKYVCKYAASEESTESRVAALAAGALLDYTWARTIWTLKLGYSASPDVTEADSPTVADALSLYPELRVSAASGAKFTVDKLVAGLWKQASAKTDRLRAATGDLRSEAK